LQPRDRSPTVQRASDTAAFATGAGREKGGCGVGNHETTNPLLGRVRLDRDELLDRFRRTRSRSVNIAEPLSPEDMTVQVATHASPTKWHLAHTTWFFETFVLEQHDPSFAPYDPAFRVLFNSYYRGIGDRPARDCRGFMTRPGVGEVLAYRDTVDERLGKVINSLAGDELASALAVLELGIQHEQQHQELMLTDIKLTLAASPLWPAYLNEHAGDDTTPVIREPASRAPHTEGRFIAFDAGLAEVGFDPATHGEVFAYDNEGPRHRRFLEPFEIAARPATNAEILAFIEDGGYERPELWLDLGWSRAESERWAAPLYWKRDERGDWQEYTHHGLQPLDPDATASYLSFFEADAFARWSGARLPTEAEWEHARAENALEAAGDAWEWTRSAHEPYPGYAPPPGAIGEYNGKFMCNQYVLRGESRLTTPGHTRPTYRNFFEPEARWQCAGVRLARTTAD